MQIIFGRKALELIGIDSAYTLLELDTIQPSPDHESEPSYCVLTNVPLTEIHLLEQKNKMHNDMLTFYRSQQWDECEDLIKLLRGSWNGEIDSFYDELLQRMQQYRSQPPETNWDAVYRPWLNSRPQLS
jgi:hypothetical protein